MVDWKGQTTVTVDDPSAIVRFRPALFLLVFAGAYALLHYLYFSVPDPWLRDCAHYYGIVLPAAKLVNFVAPQEAVSAAKGTLESSRASLGIVRGCDGAGVAFLLVAAVVGCPVRLKHKLLGILGGVLLTYALNELRVVSLYFVAAYRPEWFEPLHNYFVPIFLIVATGLFFLSWTAWTQARAQESDTWP
jgi:exosortase family protein XrtM